MGPKRAFTEVVKKRIAASQRWLCSACRATLESTYQVDHTVPLWAGGEDHPSNATAMCAACHARKTQVEAIARSERRMAERRKRRLEFERRIEKEEAERRVEKKERDGTLTCKDCAARYYPMFPHACREVERRCASRLKKKHQIKRAKTRRSPNLFEEYYFSSPREYRERQ